MKKNILLKIMSFIGLSFISLTPLAQINELDTDLGDSYYYVDHFETVINNPVDKVWPHVIEMGKWMPWMAGDNTEVKAISEGEKIHLYDEFFIEVVKIIPQKMILLANLPSIDRGEQSQGVAMVSIAEHNGKTIVSIFMSRIYNWFETGNNSQKKTRESAEFSNQRKTTFKDNFLAKLKQLVEA